MNSLMTTASEKGSNAEVYTKECAICGKFFETTTKQRKYCDTCRDHPENKSREYARGLMMSKNRLYEPEVLEYTCAHCGEKFKTIQRLVLSSGSIDNKEYFCSPKCKEEHLKARATCRFCGKSLKDKEDYAVGVWSKQFCDDKCLAQYNWHVAEEKGKIKKCALCGEAFVSGKQRKFFCSQTCYSAAVKKGWKPPVSDGPKTCVQLLPCIVCGKRVKREFPLPLPREFTPTFCTKTCYDKYQADQIEQQRRREASILAYKSEKHPRKPVTKNDNLCATCKTPYRDCEKMRSNFQTLPEGACCNKAGVVVSCPRYKT